MEKNVSTSNPIDVSTYKTALPYTTRRVPRLGYRTVQGNGTEMAKDSSDNTFCREEILWAGYHYNACSR